MKHIFIYIAGVIGLLVMASCEKFENDFYKPFTKETVGNTVNENVEEYIIKDIKIAGADTVFTINGVSFKMIRVEGGTFMMGSNDEEDLPSSKPVHEVTLSTYYIGETEVTQELYRAVMGSCPSSFTEKNMPAACLTYEAAFAMTEKLKDLTGFNFSLPTEAQWEYAARGGNRSHGYIYSGSDNLIKVANCHKWVGGTKIEDGNPERVSQRMANELGIYDMTGNVLEICYGWWELQYPSKPQINPLGGTHPDAWENRILRGGAYFSSSQAHRVAYRGHSSSYIGKKCTGMRLSIW